MKSVYDVVKKIVGIEIPVEIDPDLKTWGMFKWSKSTKLCRILLRYSIFNTLNCYTAAHEAFHCKRYLDDEEYYRLVNESRNEEAYCLINREESVVNAMALHFCITNFPFYRNNFKAIYKALEIDFDSFEKMDRDKFDKGYCVQIHNDEVRSKINAGIF